MRLFAIFALVSLAFPQLACADAPKAEKMPTPSILAYGDNNPACQEWTDGCVVCLRNGSGQNCSTPGIACQPGEIRCKPPAK